MTEEKNRYILTKDETYNLSAKYHSDWAFIRNFLLWPLTANHYSFLDGIDKPPAYPAGNRGKPQILGSCPGAAESRRKNRAGDFSRGTATVFISESILQKAGTKRESCVRGTDACSIPGSGDSAEAGVKEYFRKKTISPNKKHSCHLRAVHKSAFL